MSTKKPSTEEDEYFAKEDAARRHKIAAEKSKKTAADERERLKKLHHMKCPKCGFDLETVLFQGVNIDRCFHCGGNWLDHGELEQLAGHDSDIIKRIVAVFRKP
jgi:hypothetical protein